MTTSEPTWVTFDIKMVKLGENVHFIMVVTKNNPGDPERPMEPTEPNIKVCTLLTIE